MRYHWSAQANGRSMLQLESEEPPQRRHWGFPQYWGLSIFLIFFVSGFWSRRPKDRGQDTMHTPCCSVLVRHLRMSLTPTSLIRPNVQRKFFVVVLLCGFIWCIQNRRNCAAFYDTARLCLGELNLCASRFAAGLHTERQDSSFSRW